MELWREVLQSWRTYRAWALRLVGACGLLAECVSAEQAAEQMARGLPATPSLFGAARLAFRSQVRMARLRVRGHPPGCPSSPMGGFAHPFVFWHPLCRAMHVCIRCCPPAH